MTTKEHIKQELHAAMAEHHVRMGKIHQAALKKASGMEDEGGEEFHKAAMAEHTAMAEHHLACCKALDSTHKAMGMSDGDQLRPDDIQSILPDAPHIRPIPRFGQPTDFEKSAVEPTLAKIFDSDDE